jgi:hypothetical protein
VFHPLTSPARLRELERASTRATESLRFAEAEVNGRPLGSASGRALSADGPGQSRTSAASTATLGITGLPQVGPDAITAHDAPQKRPALIHAACPPVGVCQGLDSTATLEN